MGLWNNDPSGIYTSTIVIQVETTCAYYGGKFMVVSVLLVSL